MVLKNKIWIMVLLVFSLVLTACNPVIPDGVEIPENGSLVVVSNQTVKLAGPDNRNHKILIDFVHFDETGFVVIKLVNIKRITETIGVSKVIEGSKSNIKIDVEFTDELMVTGGVAMTKKMVAYLHKDNGDGVYEMPGPDGPVIYNGKQISKVFYLRVES